MLRIFFRGAPESAGRKRPPGLLIAAVAMGALTAAGLTGCNSEEAVVTYTVPTNLPPQLEQGDQRIAAAMVPHGDQVWFFKLLGPEPAVESVEPEVRQFVEQIELEGGLPKLDSLPESWQSGPEKPMREATLLIPSDEKQLELSVSQLARQDDWDEQVAMNVNRWRGQVGLPPSDSKWGGAEALEVPAADGQAVWVEMTGSGGDAPSQPTGMPPMAAAMSGEAPSPAASAETAPAERPDPPPSEPEVSFDRPDGWREGRMSMMRLAAFNAGPEDAPAEVTVIRAGGDTRGNVARWLGQLWGNQQPPEEVVDQAMAEAESLEVDNRPAERFDLKGEDPARGDAIDATIVPLEDGLSLFIKMTGPVDTITGQSDEMASFLDSLKL